MHIVAFLLTFVVWFFMYIDSVAGSYKTLSVTPSLIESDLGTRCTLHCNFSHRSFHHIFWRKDGKELDKDLSWTVYQHRAALVSQSLQRNDAGNYTCTRDNRSEVLSAVLVVRTPPGKLANVTVRPTSVMVTIRWVVGDTGGLPLTHFTLIVHDLYQGPDSERMRNGSTTRTHLPIHISPNARQFFVYHLHPSSSYMFRIWCSNRLGPGEPTSVYFSTAAPVLSVPGHSSHSGNTSSHSGGVLPRLLFTNEDELSGPAWMIAVAMVLGTVFLLSCISCLLIYKEGSSEHESLITEAENIQDEGIVGNNNSATLNSNGSAHRVAEGEGIVPSSPSRFFFPFHRSTNQRAVCNSAGGSNNQSASRTRPQPGERSFLLDHVDYNDNSEVEPVRLNNNSVVRPSIV